MLSNTSFCNVNGERDTSIKITYKNGKIAINDISKKTKCYLYFDKIKGEVIVDKIKSQSKGEKTSFTGIATASDTGIYSAPDDYGTSYYFRGLEGSLNNWVKFGGFYWRIIRVNGNGTVRIVYSGTVNGDVSNANKTGETTQIGTSMYNHTGNDNAYVGYMMGIPLNGTDATTANTTSSNSSSYSEAHINTYESDVKKTLDNWYQNNIANNEYYAKLVDVNTGFCNDREIDKNAHSSYVGNGYEIQQSGYAPWGRLYQNGKWKKTQTPSLQCSKKPRDLFTTNTLDSENKGNKKLTYPVGLIASDEVIFAGGFGGVNNLKYYLYTSQFYWTMSPHTYNGGAVMSIVNSDGHISNAYVSATHGLRPTINLRSDTKFKGTGSETDPFIVV